MADSTIQLWGVIGTWVAIVGVVVAVVAVIVRVYLFRVKNMENVDIIPINLGGNINKFKIYNAGQRTVEITELFWQKGDKKELICTGSFDFYPNDSMPSHDKPKVIKQGESVCFDSASNFGYFVIPTRLIDKSVDMKKQIKQIKFCVRTSSDKTFPIEASEIYNEYYYKKGKKDA